MERGDLERAALAREQFPVGIDEVGRGCIAGPVVTAAVVLDYGKLFALPDKSLQLIRDSKTLSARQRGLIVPIIESIACDWASASASVQEIEAHGILGATFIAMRRSLNAIGAHFDLVMVDGNQAIPDPVIAGRKVAQQTVVKGDHWCFAIAAASILAKEVRDKFMQELGNSFPAYGFGKHVGYGTREHIENLKIHGVTEWHRRTFEPVKSICAAKVLASQAEEYVTNILISQSWRIIARNYRWIGTEIDILAAKGSSLVAIEVKFRTKFTHDMTSVSELLPRLKVHALKKGLNAAIRHLGINAAKTRIDLAIVTPHSEIPETKMPPGKSPEGIKNYPFFKVRWYPAIDA